MTLGNLLLKKSKGNGLAKAYPGQLEEDRLWLAKYLDRACFCGPLRTYVEGVGDPSVCKPCFDFLG